MQKQWQWAVLASQHVMEASFDVLNVLETKILIIIVHLKHTVTHLICALTLLCCNIVKTVSKMIYMNLCVYDDVN